MGYRDKMDRISVDSIRLGAFVTTPVFDILTVQVTASMIDYRVAIDSGKYLEGDREPQLFTEFWSFVLGLLASPPAPVRWLFDKGGPS